MIQFNCSKCGEPMEAPASEAGSALKCPKCGLHEKVPSRRREAVRRVVRALLVCSALTAIGFVFGDLNARYRLKRNVAKLELKCSDMETDINELRGDLNRKFGTPANEHDARCMAAAVILERYAYATGIIKNFIEDTVMLDWTIYSNEPETVADLALKRIDVIEAYLKDLTMPKEKNVIESYQKTLEAVAAVRQKAQSIINFRKRYPGMWLFNDNCEFNEKQFYGFEGPCQDATLWIEALQRQKLPELRDATLWIYTSKHHPEEFAK